MVELGRLAAPIVLGAVTLISAVTSIWICLHAKRNSLGQWSEGSIDGVPVPNNAPRRQNLDLERGVIQDIPNSRLATLWRTVSRRSRLSTVREENGHEMEVVERDDVLEVVQGVEVPAVEEARFGETPREPPPVYEAFDARLGKVAPWDWAAHPW